MTMRDAGPPAIGFTPAGHDLVEAFDPGKLDAFPRTRARYDALLEGARSPTSRRQLHNVAHALLHLHGTGTRRIGLRAVGAVTQRIGGPNAKTLSNATSEHHRTLITTFCKETGTDAKSGGDRPDRSEGPYDEIVRSLDKMHHRVVVRDLVQSVRSMRSQIEILRRQLADSMHLASLRGVVGEGPTAGARDAGSGREETWRAGIREAFSDEFMEDAGLDFRGGALRVIRIDLRVLEPAVVEAIRGLAGMPSLESPGGD